MDKCKIISNCTWLFNACLLKTFNITQVSIKEEDIKYRIVKISALKRIIAEQLVVHLIIDFKTVKADRLKIKLGFNQLDPIITKQQAIGLRLRKLFSNEEIFKDFSSLNYLIDFCFPK